MSDNQDNTQKPIIEGGVPENDSPEMSYDSDMELNAIDANDIEDVYEDTQDFDGQDIGDYDRPPPQYGFDEHRSNSKLILIVVLVLAVLGFGGFYFMTTSSDTEIMASMPVQAPTPDAQASVEEQEQAPQIIKAQALPTDDMIIPASETTEADEALAVVTEGQDVVLVEQADVNDESASIIDSMPDEVGLPDIASDAPENDEVLEDDMTLEALVESYDEGEIDAEAAEVVASTVLDDNDVPSETSLSEPVIEAEAETTEAVVESAETPAQDDQVAETIATREPENLASETYFDADTDVTYNSASGVGDKGDYEIKDPKREYYAQFITVSQPASNVITTDNHSDDLARAQRALALNRPDAAIEFYDRLYAKNKRDMRILMGRANTLQVLGRNVEAIEAYEEILDLDPNNTGAVVNLMSLVQSQNPQGAVQRLMALQERYPTNAGVVAQLGLAFAQINRYDDALKYLSMAQSLSPDNALFSFNKAVIYDRMGNTSQAILMYEKALEQDAVYGGNISREAIYDRLAILR